MANFGCWAFLFAYNLDGKSWTVGSTTLVTGAPQENQILSKAIQKPAQLAAVENAARLIDNTGETSLQAGCVVGPLQAGCVVAPLQAGCVVDAGVQIRVEAPEEPLLAGYADDNVSSIEAK